jgi:hypothetical protein
MAGLWMGGVSGKKIVTNLDGGADLGLTELEIMVILFDFIL